MSRRIFFTFLSILVSLPFLVLIPTLVRGQTNGVYGVSGYVYDDLNANGRYDAGEPGVPNAVIYADNTQSGYRAYTDAYGHWQIPVLPPGAHSIEIQNAGAAGSRPTTSEKFLVSGPTSAVSFGMQNGGYDVTGQVLDENGRPVSGATVYSDFPNRETAITNSSGFYTLRDMGYDSSNPIPGQQGGHNIYVQGYNGNPVLVNPQYATATLPAPTITVVTNQGGTNCGPTYAKDPNSGSCGYFNDRCTLPSGWYPVTSCGGTTPPPGQCTNGQRVPGSGTQTCNYQTQQRCMVYSYYNSSSCASTYQGGLEECQYVTGFCGYQSGGTGGQCTPGQQVGSTQYRCNNMNQQCTVTTHNNANCTGTYENQSCGYVVGQCGYTCPPGYSCLAGSTSSDGFSTLQGEQSGFQDISVPAPVYYDTPATPIDYSWSVQPSQPSYSAPYDGGWYDQRTPYIAPDWY